MSDLSLLLPQFSLSKTERMFVSSCFLLASCVCFIFLLWERGGTFNSLPIYPIFILFNLLLVLILTSAVLSQSEPHCSREPSQARGCGTRGSSGPCWFCPSPQRPACWGLQLQNPLTCPLPVIMPQIFFVTAQK